jgi:toxin ParE1/3/4
MSRYILSPQANSDLTGIFDYIAKERPRAASRVVGKIIKRLESLADHPLSGEAQPKYGADTRFSTVENYLIIYRPRDQGIEVVRIIHGARDYDALLS